MDIERELLAAVWITLAEFALNGPITRAYVVLHNITHDETQIINLGQLLRGPVVEQLSALQHHMAKTTRIAIINMGMECTVIQP